MQKTYLVLFPGAWGNRTEEIVRWWFQWVIRFFVDRISPGNLVIVPLTYHGDSLIDFAVAAERQLRQVTIPPESKIIAVGYSMGGVVLHLVAAILETKGKRGFDRVVPIASCGPKSMRTIGFLRGYRAITLAFTIGAFLGKVTLTKIEEVYRVFFNTSSRNLAFDELCRRVLEHSHPESFWACLQLAVWPFRLEKTPPLKIRVDMILSESDILFRDELDRRSTGGEDWNIIKVKGGHGAILDRDAMFAALNQINFD